MAFFKGLKGAKASTKSDYINPGRIITQIQRVKKSESKQDGNDQIHAEQTVIVQLTKEAPKFPNGTQAPLNVPGQAVSHRFKGGDKQRDEMAAADYKAFIMGATGQPESAIDDDDGEVVFGPDNPLGGRFVEVNAVAGQTKKGAPFTYINYVRPVPAADVLKLIDADTKAKLFPGDALEKLVAAEAAQAAEPQG